MARGFRRRGALFAALLALIAGVFAASGASATSTAAGSNTKGAPAARLGVEAAASPTYQADVEFSSAFDTHTFTIQVGRGGNRFTADTLDCCLSGDHWGVFVMRYGGTPTGVSNQNDSNCGTGDISSWSGAAALSGSYLSGKSVQVVVTHCSGVSTFPAGLTVRFPANVPIAVTQRT